MSPFPRGVDAVQGAASRAVARIPPDGHVHAIAVEHRAADDLAHRQQASVAVAMLGQIAGDGLVVAGRPAEQVLVAQRVVLDADPLVLGQVAVVGPDLPQLHGLVRHFRQGLEGVAQAVAAAVEDERLAARPRPATAETTARATAACRSARRRRRPDGRCACRARSGWGRSGSAARQACRTSPASVRSHCTSRCTAGRRGSARRC